jgi:hypothetical protein
MARKKNKRYTLTSGYLIDKEPAIPRDHSLLIPAWVADNRRMTFWKPTEKMDWSAKDLASAILGSTPTTALMFCDTNFFSAGLDFVVWDAILTRKIVITPLVRIELQPWILSPRHNEQVSELVKHASASSHDKVEFLQLASEHKKHGYDHYFALLTHRTMRGMELQGELHARLNRVPTDNEFKAECQRRCGDRGFRLAYKGWEGRGKPNNFADEELVVLAVQTAILRGRDVVLLSRDLDIEEQFMKLMAFLQHDYSAMLVADAYHSDPSRMTFEAGAWPPFVGYVEDDELLVWKTNLATVEALKPADYRTIRLHSVIVGSHEGQLKVTPLSFNAETGLKRLLAVKSATNGMNTNKLQGKNCRLGSVMGSPFVAPIICRDKMVQLGCTLLPALDKRFATCVDEDVAPVEWT